MTTETEAEKALPPGVARSSTPGEAVERSQLTAGGVGPGGQTGPDPVTRPLQEGRTYARPVASGHQEPLSGAPDAPGIAEPTDQADGQDRE